MELYGRQWEKVNDFRPSDNDWLVVTTELGELWMNNLDGVMHFVAKSGRVLKTYI